MRKIYFRKNLATEDSCFSIDDEDFEKIKGQEWYMVDHYNGGLVIFKKASQEEIKEGWPTAIQLPQFLLGLKEPKDSIIYLNGDVLDNRRRNLRKIGVESAKRLIEELKKAKETA